MAKRKYTPAPAFTIRSIEPLDRSPSARAARQAEYRTWLDQFGGSRNRQDVIAAGSFSAEQWQAMLDRYGRHCLCCGRSDIRLVPDHVIPIDCGGPHEAANIQPLCIRCNYRKGKQSTDYRPSHV